jgi:hypothetical protein
MKNLLFIFITLITINSFSQDEKSLSPVEFQKLKTSYLEMTNSESYRAMRTESKLIASKLNVLQLENVNTGEDFNKWIKENISKTKFPSIEEANSMFATMMNLSSKVLDEFKDVYNQFSKASQKQSLELIMDEQSRELK